MLQIMTDLTVFMLKATTERRGLPHEEFQVESFRSSDTR